MFHFVQHCLRNRATITSKYDQEKKKEQQKNIRLPLNLQWFILLFVKYTHFDCYTVMDAIITMLLL